MFATPSPASSAPYFVSRQAFEYATAKLKAKRDTDSMRPPKKTKAKR